MKIVSIIRLMFGLGLSFFSVVLTNDGSRVGGKHVDGVVNLTALGIFQNMARFGRS